MARSKSPRGGSRSPRGGASPALSAAGANAAKPKEVHANKDAQVLAILVCTVAAAPLTLVLFETFPAMHENHVILGISGVVCLVAAVLWSWKIYPACGVKSSVLGSAWTLVIFTAVLDGILVLTVMGYVDLGRFYYTKGERYFQSAAGVMILAWDGAAHALVQTWLAWMILTDRDNRSSFKYVGLMWCGSIINSMMPLLVGAAVGPFSGEIQVSTALNAPYVVFPTLVAIQLYARRHHHARVRMPLLLAGALCVYHVAVAASHVVRVMVALQSQASVADWFAKQVEPVLVFDQSKFIAVQAMQWMFWFVPWHLVCTFDLAMRALGRTTFFTTHSPDVAALALGAYMQAQFVIVGTSLTEWQDFRLVNRPSSQPLSFWMVQAGMLMGLLAYFWALIKYE
jgi:hypothetical protein